MVFMRCAGCAPYIYRSRLHATFFDHLEDHFESSSKLTPLLFSPALFDPRPLPCENPRAGGGGTGIRTSQALNPRSPTTRRLQEQLELELSQQDARDPLLSPWSLEKALAVEAPARPAGHIMTSNRKSLCQLDRCVHYRWVQPS